MKKKETVTKVYIPWWAYTCVCILWWTPYYVLVNYDWGAFPASLVAFGLGVFASHITFKSK